MNLGVPIAALAILCSAAAYGRTFGNDIAAVGPADLPAVGTVLSVDMATRADKVVACIGGWAQNWDTDHNTMTIMPGIGVYDEGPPGEHLHQRLCPTVQIGNTLDASGIEHTSFKAQNFMLSPVNRDFVIQPGDLVSVEVDVEGKGELKGGGVLWNKAVGQ